MNIYREISHISVLEEAPPEEIERQISTREEEKRNLGRAFKVTIQNSRSARERRWIEIGFRVSMESEKSEEAERERESDHELPTDPQHVARIGLPRHGLY